MREKETTGSQNRSQEPDFESRGRAGANSEMPRFFSITINLCFMPAIYKTDVDHNTLNLPNITRFRMPSVSGR